MSLETLCPSGLAQSSAWVALGSSPSWVLERSLEPRTELSPDVQELCQVIIAGNGRGLEQSVQTGSAPFRYFSYFVDLFYPPAKDLPCLNLYSRRDERLDTAFCLFFKRSTVPWVGLCWSFYRTPCPQPQAGVGGRLGL